MGDEPNNQNCIQQRINDNIADVPIFYGRPEKEPVTLKFFVSRIDQGVVTLHGLKWMHTITSKMLSSQLRPIGWIHG